MNKIISSILFLSFACTVSTSAQVNGFIKQNGVEYKRNGIQTEDGYYPYLRIKLQNKEGTFFLYPDKISGYQNEKKHYFESFDILVDNVTERYFLELVADESLGKVFFCIDKNYQKRLFLLRESLVELHDDDLSELYYKTVLQDVGDCAEKDEILQYVNFSKESVARTFGALSKCQIQFTPKPAFFIALEYVNFSLSPSIDINDPLIIPRMFLTDNVNSRTSSAFGISIGYSIPINTSKVSFDQTLGYYSFDETVLSSFNLASYRLEYSVRIVEYAPMVRVRTARNKWQTSFSFGPLVAFPISNDTNLFATTFNTATDEFVNATQDQSDNNTRVGYKFKVHLENLLKNQSSVGIFLTGGQLFEFSSGQSGFNINRLSIGLSYGISK